MIKTRKMCLNYDVSKLCHQLVDNVEYCHASISIGIKSTKQFFKRKTKNKKKISNVNMLSLKNECQINVFNKKVLVE